MTSNLGDPKPTHDQIAVRATILWKAFGGPADRDEEIWLEAERQLADEAKETESTSRETRAATPAAAPAKETEITAPSKPPSGGRSGKRRSS